MQHFKVEQRQPVQLAHQRKHTAVVRRAFAQDRHQFTQPHQAHRIKPGQDHPAIIDQDAIGLPQQAMRIAAPRQGMRQQAGVDGLFGKGQMQRVGPDLHWVSRQRDIHLVRDGASFGIDFRAQIANLKQMKAI